MSQITFQNIINDFQNVANQIMQIQNATGVAQFYDFLVTPTAPLIACNPADHSEYIKNAGINF